MRMMKKMDIYIKPKEKVMITGRKNVYLKDIGELLIAGQTAGNLENLVVFQIPEEREKTYLLSIITIIQEITKNFPNSTVNNVGEKHINKKISLRINFGFIQK